MLRLNGAGVTLKKEAGFDEEQAVKNIKIKMMNRFISSPIQKNGTGVRRAFWLSIYLLAKES